MRKIRAGLILGSVFLLSACSKAAQDETLRIGFPEPSTTEGILILNLWQGTWIVALRCGGPCSWFTFCSTNSLSS